MHNAKIIIIIIFLASLSIESLSGSETCTVSMTPLPACIERMNERVH